MHKLCHPGSEPEPELGGCSILLLLLSVCRIGKGGLTSQNQSTGCFEGSRSEEQRLSSWLLSLSPFLSNRNVRCWSWDSGGFSIYFKYLGPCRLNLHQRRTDGSRARRQGWSGFLEGQARMTLRWSQYLGCGGLGPRSIWSPCKGLATQRGHCGMLAPRNRTELRRSLVAPLLSPSGHQEGWGGA